MVYRQRVWMVSDWDRNLKNRCDSRWCRMSCFVWIPVFCCIYIMKCVRTCKVGCALVFGSWMCVESVNYAVGCGMKMSSVFQDLFDQCIYIYWPETLLCCLCEGVWECSRFYKMSMAAYLNKWIFKTVQPFCCVWAWYSEPNCLGFVWKLGLDGALISLLALWNIKWKTNNELKFSAFILSCVKVKQKNTANRN